MENGELRFFCSFSTPGLRQHTVLRYFYFLDGKCSDYPTLSEDKGEWMNMEQLTRINQRRPHALSSYLLADARRMLTIMRTEKLYDERGFRRYKIKSYVPQLRISDIRKTQIDF